MGDKHQLVRDTVLSSPWHVDTLRAVRALAPDWAIGAGFVRNAVWDRLHGFQRSTQLADVDVLFFDPSDVSPEREAVVVARLAILLPDRPWEVRNQARMHVRNQDRPYTSTADAMSFWLETPTCVAVRLNDDDTIEIIAPYGLEDLVDMRCRPTARGLERLDRYRDRMHSKGWPETWPHVRVESLR